MGYKKIEQYDDEVTLSLKDNYKSCLALLGENAEREGLLKTPERVAKAMQFLTQGYNLDAHAILDSAKFHEEVSEMIIVKDIEIYSLCEHHMLPFFGKAHVAYIPNGNSVTTTSAFFGQFEKNETRSEFVKLISANLH